MGGPVLVSVAAGLGLVLGRPLAGLSRTVVDPANRRWYRGTRPPARRVLVVGLVGAAFAALAARAAGWNTSLPAWLALAVVLTPLAVVDAEWHRLPDRLVFTGYGLAAALLGLAALLDHRGGDLARAGLAALVVFTAFTALGATGGVGFGDVKLAGLLGAYLGWLGWAEVAAGLFAGFVVGAVVALVLIVGRRAGMRSAIAFGPSLMVGALLVAAWG